ncbi:MAG: hypothetical protein ABJM26_20695 [Anderseniella sp.]
MKQLPLNQALLPPTIRSPHWFTGFSNSVRPVFHDRKLRRGLIVAYRISGRHCLAFKETTMNFVKAAVFSAALIFSSSGQALAFNFGFVRVPDWMDTYIVWLVAATLVSMIGLSLTKPGGVPMNQLSNVQISPMANVFRVCMLIAFVVLMTLVFVGMGMRRYAEA